MTEGKVYDANPGDFVYWYPHGDTAMKPEVALVLESDHKGGVRIGRFRVGNGNMLTQYSFTFCVGHPDNDKRREAIREQGAWLPREGSANEINSLTERVAELERLIGMKVSGVAGAEKRPVGRPKRIEEPALADA